MKNKEIISLIYTDALRLIEIGQYEKAAQFLLKNELSLNSDSNSHSIPLSTLIHFRLAIKANTVPLDGQHALEVLNIYDKKIKAEIYLVNGIYYNSSRLFKLSKQSFIQASLLYKELEWSDKYFTCVYNSIITDINDSDIFMTEDHLQNLIKLQLEAEELQNKKILGLIYRQKSYFFKEQKRWHAALEEAERAVHHLEGRAFTSDYHLALLNLADCYYELELLNKAQASIEKIFPPIDSRVQFAYRFITKRINNLWNDTELKQLILSNEMDPHFLYRAQITNMQNVSKNTSINQKVEKIYQWNKNKGVMQSNHQQWPLTSFSKEYQLLTLLTENAKSAEYLISVLWPLYSERAQLEGRLYTLISRINKNLMALLNMKKENTQLMEY